MRISLILLVGLDLLSHQSLSLGSWLRQERQSCRRETDWWKYISFFLDEGSAFPVYGWVGGWVDY